MVQFGGYFRRRQSSQAVWKFLRLPHTPGFSGVFVHSWVSQHKASVPEPTLYLCELELSTFLPWASASLYINRGCVGVGLNDLTMSKDSKVFCCMDCETVLESHRKLGTKPAARSEFYLLFTTYQDSVYTSVLWYFSTSPSTPLPHTSPGERHIWLYSLLSVSTSLQPTSILWLDFS